jgi:hypothetical protein
MWLVGVGLLLGVASAQLDGLIDLLNQAGCPQCVPRMCSVLATCVDGTVQTIDLTSAGPLNGTLLSDFRAFMHLMSLKISNGLRGTVNLTGLNQYNFRHLDLSNNR